MKSLCGQIFFLGGGYGLFAYEEFAELAPVSEEMFNAVSGQYLKVAIGKELIDMEKIVSLAERYQKFF